MSLGTLSEPLNAGDIVLSEVLEGQQYCRSNSIVVTVPHLQMLLLFCLSVSSMIPLEHWITRLLY